MVEAAAALSPPERRAVATLAIIYAVRMLGLFLLLPVLALYAGSIPGGTPLMAGLAVGAYGLTQALLQIPFGVWSDRLGRRPLIVAGLLLHIGGSALGYFAATAWALVAARTVQGMGAVSGPVMALLADRTRPASRTRAMAFIGMSIGLSFVVSLVGGPLLAGKIGVSGIFALIGGLGVVALALILFAVPKETARAQGPGRRSWREVLTRRLLPYYAGIFILHLSLTATFIAVPHALRDVHGIAAPQHWEFYLAVFASSLALTVPLLLWSERSAKPARPVVAGALLLALAQGALALCYVNFLPMARGARDLLRRLQLPRGPPAVEPRRRGGRRVAWRGARRVLDLPVCGGLCRRDPGRRPPGKFAGHPRRLPARGPGRSRLADGGRPVRIPLNSPH